MNRANDKGNHQDIEEKVEKVIRKLPKEKLERIAPTCKDQFIFSDGRAFCLYHDPGVTECRFQICPRLDISTSDAAIIEESSNPKSLLIEGGNTVNQKDEQILDALMFCSDTLHVLEKEYDPILSREAKRAADGVIHEILDESRSPDE